VVTADEIGAAAWDDERLLRWAHDTRSVLVSHDHDFLSLADRYQRESREFSGIVFCQLGGLAVRSIVEDLVLVARAISPDEMIGKVIRVPL